MDVEVHSAQRPPTFSFKPSEGHVTSRLAQEECIESVMERVSMAEQLQPYIKAERTFGSLVHLSC